MSQSERVVVDRTDGVVHVQLDRPEKRDALDGPMMDALVETAKQLATDGDNQIEAVVARLQKREAKSKDPD